MWNGVFSPSLTKGITDHFDIINIDYNEIFEMYYVTVEFHKSPGKQYVFEIPEKDFQRDKGAIGAEILKQLRS